MDTARYIVAGGLIDGSGTDGQRNVFLAVRDGTITAIGPAAELPGSGEGAIDDLSHCTIVPPLIDCSVFLAQSPSVDEKVRAAVGRAGPAKKSELVMRHIRYCHDHGVLGVAAVDAGFDPEEYGRDLKEQGKCIDIRAAGRDFVRIEYSSGGDGRMESRENLRQMLQLQPNKKTVVAANGERSVREALDAGCDAIEQGYTMGEENLRRMAETDVLWIPRVLMARNGLQGSASGGDVMCRFSMRYVAPGKPDPAAETFWKKMLVLQLDQLRLAKELGVKTAVGTGAGSVGILHGESVSEEIKLFIKAGWSLAEAIRCASVVGAGFFTMDNLGPLAVGRKATFLAARGTAQQLPRKLAYLEGVYVKGKRTEV